MLTQTSEMAIKALLYLGRFGDGEPTSPRVIAKAIGCSPSYLGKTLRLLVRAGILRSKRGAHGGVWLARKPGDVNLLQVVEACQGLIVGNYCQALDGSQPGRVCAFHRAMREIYDTTVGTLSRWNLGHLLQQPSPKRSGRVLVTCKMSMSTPAGDGSPNAGKDGLHEPSR